LDQRGAMAVLLLGHLVEYLGRLRIILAQALRVPTIDAGVVLLGGDREREHLLLGQVPELPLVQKTRDHRGSNASTDVGARGRERILPFRPRANFPSDRHWPQGCRSFAQPGRRSAAASTPRQRSGS